MKGTISLGAELKSNAIGDTSWDFIAQLTSEIDTHKMCVKKSFKIGHQRVSTALSIFNNRFND